MTAAAGYRQFFGLNHEEVGGAFESQEDQIAGAFGVGREE